MRLQLLIIAVLVSVMAWFATIRMGVATYDALRGTAFVATAPDQKTDV